MKTLAINLCLLFLASICYAQETIEVTNKLGRNFTEVYSVLKSDMKTREGMYQMRYKKIALASGVYHNNERKGNWHFFDQKGTVLQNFNYDANLLTYEKPFDKKDLFKYKLDKPYIEKDTVTKPLKIGGRYAGYQSLLALFKKPDDVNRNYYPYLNAQIELLVSPYGNLADYTIHIDGLDLNVNLNLLADEDKKFVPATINREAVASTITIPVIMKANGTLLLFGDVEWKDEQPDL